MPQSNEEEIMHFHYMTYMATPYHKSLCFRGHKIYHFLFIITVYLMSWNIWGDFFKNYINSSLFTPKLATFPRVGSLMKFTFSCPLTLQMIHSKFGKDLSTSSWEEDVYTRQTTDNVWQRTWTPNNRAPAWLRYFEMTIMFLYYPSY